MRREGHELITLLLAVPGGAAGANGLLWAASRALVPALPEDTAFAAAVAAFYAVLTLVFWFWRMRPAVQSGEFQGTAQTFLGAAITVAAVWAIVAGLGAAVRFASGEDLAPEARPWIMGAMALAGAFVSLQGLRQARWFLATYRHAALLPTSKLRSVAAGAVEVRGAVVAGAGELPLVHKNDERDVLKPFRIDDGTGAVPVHAPPDADVSNEDNLLRLRYENGVPVLAPGDRVRVLGAYDVTRDPPALAPFLPPGGASFIGSPFGRAHVFAVFPDDERALHDELAAKARAWVGFSLAWLAGAVLYGLLPWVG